MPRRRSRPRARSRYWLRVALVILLIMLFIIAPSFVSLLGGGNGPATPTTVTPAGR